MENFSASFENTRRVLETSLEIFIFKVFNQRLKRVGVKTREKVMNLVLGPKLRFGKYTRVSRQIFKGEEN